jgi:peroxin-12
VPGSGAGVGTEFDGGVAPCPLCLRECVEPAMASCSGYVFCFPCLRSHVERHGQCPVTLVPMRGLEDIRRLFGTT